MCVYPTTQSDLSDTYFRALSSGDQEKICWGLTFKPAEKATAYRDFITLLPKYLDETTQKIKDLADQVVPLHRDVLFQDKEAEEIAESIPSGLASTWLSLKASIQARKKDIHTLQFFNEVHKTEQVFSQVTGSSEQLLCEEAIARFEKEIEDINTLENQILSLENFEELVEDSGAYPEDASFLETLSSKEKLELFEASFSLKDNLEFAEAAQKYIRSVVLTEDWQEKVFLEAAKRLEEIKPWIHTASGKKRLSLLEQRDALKNILAVAYSAISSVNETPSLSIKKTMQRHLNFLF